MNEQQGASSSSLSKRHYSLVFFRSRTNAGKISEWSKDGLRGDASTHYSCVLCRKLRSKTNRNNNPSAQLGRAAGIVIRNGRFIIDPDNPNPPHICNFDNNPLSDEVEVLKRRSQLLRRDYIKAKRQAKDKRKVMGGGMFFVNTVESEDDEEQQVAAEYGIATTSTSEAFDHCSNSYAAEDCSARRLYPNENLHGNIVFEIKSNRDGITKSITKQIEVCEDGANDPTENYSNDSDPKYECSIVGLMQL
ncbi:unnamed protein product [Anisakis simplex]|uniref:Uncharacterized protein n=1 Tax=Anisakis simplex TaxID=6269 RepID=A0A3P6QJF7_ANISI|nr:unnamed protein product [Anisakis simplex]